ncbi:MAG: polysaccharide pyruvyl transferase family protein [Dysgonomonas sp.]
MTENRIGIMTIFSVYNYGAMLQAYALDKYLNDCGYKSEIIDYRPYSVCKAYDFYFRDLIFRPKSGLRALKQKYIANQKFKRFNSFLEHELNISKKCFTGFKALCSHNYSVLITGSDQIWNPYITNSDENFLLSFADKSVKKIAYSSSFGVSCISNNWEDRIKHYLNDFSFIGIREETGVSIVKELLPKKDVNLVLDPVFLFNKDFWHNFSESKNKYVDKYTENNYVLVYSLEINDCLVNFAKTISVEHNLKIICIHPFRNDYHFADVCINDAGPKEFVNLIKNATYVVTNSFHGTVFSIIFNKKLVCVPHSKTGSRMTNLLDRLGLKKINCEIKGNDIPLYFCSDIDISKFDEEIYLSKKFLIESIK